MEQYISVKYRQYARTVVGGKIDFSTLCIQQDSSGAASPDMLKLARIVLERSLRSSLETIFLIWITPS